MGKGWMWCPGEVCGPGGLHWDFLAGLWLSRAPPQVPGDIAVLPTSSLPGLLRNRFLMHEIASKQGDFPSQPAAGALAPQLAAWASGGDMVMAVRHSRGCRASPGCYTRVRGGLLCSYHQACEDGVWSQEPQPGHGQEGWQAAGCFGAGLEVEPDPGDPLHRASRACTEPTPSKRHRRSLGRVSSLPQHSMTSTLGDPQDSPSKPVDPGQPGAAGSLPASSRASSCLAHGIPWPSALPEQG